jgi:hypothetical protein
MDESLEEGEESKLVQKDLSATKTIIGNVQQKHMTTLNAFTRQLKGIETEYDEKAKEIYGNNYQ